MGGARVQAPLKTLLSELGMVVQPCTVRVPNAGALFDKDGRFKGRVEGNIGKTNIWTWNTAKISRVSSPFSDLTPSILITLYLRESAWERWSGWAIILYYSFPAWTITLVSRRWLLEREVQEQSLSPGERVPVVRWSNHQPDEAEGETYTLFFLTSPCRGVDSGQNGKCELFIFMYVLVFHCYISWPDFWAFYDWVSWNLRGGKLTMGYAILVLWHFILIIRKTDPTRFNFISWFIWKYKFYTIISG